MAASGGVKDICDSIISVNAGKQGHHSQLCLLFKFRGRVLCAVRRCTLGKFCQVVGSAALTGNKRALPNNTIQPYYGVSMLISPDKGRSSWDCQTSAAVGEKNSPPLTWYKVVRALADKLAGRQAGRQAGRLRSDPQMAIRTCVANLE